MITHPQWHFDAHHSMAVRSRGHLWKKTLHLATIFLTQAGKTNTRLFLSKNRRLQLNLSASKASLPLQAPALLFHSETILTTACDKLNVALCEAWIHSSDVTHFRVAELLELKVPTGSGWPWPDVALSSYRELHVQLQYNISVVISDWGANKNATQMHSSISNETYKVRNSMLIGCHSP